MSNTVRPPYSRFHAIISASPASGLPPRPALCPPPNSTYGQQNSPKRRRIDHSFNTFSRVLRDPNKDEHAASRQRPRKFASKDYLLEALKQSFKSSQTVDFHGCYELAESNMTHRQRVQSLTVDIWRATGYRFTVKDHPRINNGHKTRFWCSQDEAHRSKSSKIARLPNSASRPRVSSAGEALAKARYACKSRLLISSRDPSSIGGGMIITVRLHHHVAHEPYIESILPGATESDPSSTLLPFGYPEPDHAEEEDLGDADADPDEDMDEEGDELTSSAIAPAEFAPPVEAPPPLSVRPPTSASIFVAATSNPSSASLPLTITPSVIVSAPTSSLPTPGQPVTRNGSSPNPNPLNLPSIISSNRSDNISNTSLTIQNPSSSASFSNPFNTNHIAPMPRPQDQQHHQHHYHQRMRAHISNIREFCSGLEYQLQFDDYRMLDVLEREGASFLTLVQDCLRKEGRLDPNGEC